jgi:hypothetical protein
MTSLAMAAQLRGELSSALQITDDAARRADRSPDRLGHRYPVLAQRGLILIELDRLDEARSTLQASMRLSEDLGVQLHLPSDQVYLAFERFTAGDWDDALAQAQAGLELAEEVGETYARVTGQTVRSLILLHRNHLPGARAAADAAEAELAGTGPRHRSHWARWARALVLEADGQPGQGTDQGVHWRDAPAQATIVRQYQLSGWRGNGSLAWNVANQSRVMETYVRRN